MKNVAKSSENSEEERKREFKRQQDRLKMLAPDNERKVVTADSMIDSLLQKADTFKKAPTFNYPPWLRINTPQSCPYYEQIWNMVCATDKLVDTQRISQLLLTSGLHPDILGFIWNLANKVTPGQLNKQELFVVLSLVGLAQTGCTFNSIEVLNLVPSAPIPRLNVPIYSQSNVMASPTAYMPPTLQVKPHLHEQNSVNAPYVSSSFKSPSTVSNHILSSTVDDDFQDFQFASVPTITNVSQPKQMTTSSLTAPLDVRLTTPNNLASSEASIILSQDHVEISSPNTEIGRTIKQQAAPRSITENTTTDEFAEFQSADAFDTSIVQPSKISMPKLSSFIRVSPESERKLRQLTQPESLSALPESKISSRNQVSSMPSIALLGSSRGIGSRLANHSLSTKPEKSKHHSKVMKVKPIVSSVLPEDMFPKCAPKNSTFLLKETKISSTDLEGENNFIDDHELTRRIEIPSVGTFKETTLPVDMKAQVIEKLDISIHSSQVDKEKMTSSIQNDSLLQVQEDKYGALRDLELFNEVPEDFGEFLSADLPSEKAAEAWSAWNSSINIPDAGMGMENSEVDLLSDNFSTIDIRYDVQSKGDDFGDFIESKVDDFGDFVTTFDKSEKMSKEYSVDESKSGHSSTPSIDFSLPRQDSLSNLETSSNLSGKSRKESTPSLNLQLDANWQQITHRCLSCCSTLLKEAVDIFASVSDKNVLQEIFDSPQGNDYLKHLKIVYSIAKRILENESDSNGLFEDISDFWQQLETMAPHELSEELSSFVEASGSQKPCLVCKASTSDLDIEKDGNRFHPSCANLWINCIDSTLPTF